MLPRRFHHRLLLLLIGSVFLAIIISSLSPAGAVQPPPTAAFEKICADVLTRALKLTEQGCSATGRNEACYGYTVVQSKLQPGVDQAKYRFAAGGDILPVRLLATIRTEPLDTAQGTWGMAVLKMQANLPDTNPGQNVTFILFGDSTLQPDINHTNAFYLSTQLGNLTCKQIPQNSLLVRAPSHLTVSFTINEVEIKASSIVVLRASAGNNLLARVLEGHVSATANGTTKNLVAGQELTVPMGGPDGLRAAGVPSDPIPSPLETPLDPPAMLLNTFDPTADMYQGPITLEGPIEALNPIMPSLTLYGRIVLLGKVGGWRNLRPGDWVHVEGDIRGIMIETRVLRSDNTSLLVPARPTAKPTATPMRANSNLPPPLPPPPAPLANPSGGNSSSGNDSPPASNPPSDSTPSVSATPTNAPDRLRLTSMCSPDPAVKRVWRVQNPHTEAVSFTWDLYGSNQQGAGVAPAQGEVFFETVTEPGPNTVRLFANGVQQDVKASNPAPCNAATPPGGGTAPATDPATLPATQPVTPPATDVATDPATPPATEVATKTESPTATASPTPPRTDGTKEAK